MRANVWKELENYFLILLGTALMAIAIQWIFDRVGLITGGFTGLPLSYEILRKRFCREEFLCG